MSFPTKPTFPTWATNGGTRVEPSSGQKATGWVFQQKPPAQEFNWLDGAQCDAATWLDKAKVLAPQKVIFVDPDKGSDSLGNGSGIPFATIGAALDFIVMLRGGGTAGQDGTAGEWYAVSVAPGEYEEDIEVPGWVVVTAQVGGAVYLRGDGTATTTPAVTLAGGATQWAPCGVQGCIIARTDTNKASAYAVEVLGFAGNGGGNLSTANADAAFLDGCVIEGTDATFTKTFGGIHVTGDDVLAGPGGFLKISNSTLVLGMVSGQQILVDEGACLYIFSTANQNPECCPVVLDNAGAWRDAAVLAQTPIALVMFNVTGGGMPVVTTQDANWKTARDTAVGSTVPTPYGMGVYVQDVTVAQIDATNTSAAVAADVGMFFTAFGKVRLNPTGNITPVDGGVSANKLTLNFYGDIGSQYSLAEMLNPTNARGGPPFVDANFGNLSNGASVTFDRDALVATTTAYARTATVTVAAALSSPTSAPYAEKVFWDGADYRCGGIADANTIQVAVTAVGDAGGGVVQLGPGTFTLGAGPTAGSGNTVPILTVPENVTLRGMGAGVTVLTCGDTLHQGSAGIDCAGAKARLEGATVEGDAVDAVVLLSGLDSGVDQIEIDAADLYLTGANGAGLKIVGPIGAQIGSVYVSDSADRGVWIAGSDCRASDIRTSDSAGEGLFVDTEGFICDSVRSISDGGAGSVTLAVNADDCAIAHVVTMSTNGLYIGTGNNRIGSVLGDVASNGSWNQIDSVRGDVVIGGGDTTQIASIAGTLDVNAGTGHGIGTVYGDVTLASSSGNSAVSSIIGTLTISDGANYSVGQVAGDVDIQTDGNSVGAVFGNLTISGNRNTVTNVRDGGGSNPPVSISGNRNTVTGGSVSGNAGGTMVAISGNDNAITGLVAVGSISGDIVTLSGDRNTLTASRLGPVGGAAIGVNATGDDNVITGNIVDLGGAAGIAFNIDGTNGNVIAGNAVINAGAGLAYNNGGGASNAVSGNSFGGGTTHYSLADALGWNLASGAYNKA